MPYRITLAIMFLHVVPSMVFLVNSDVPLFPCHLVSPPCEHTSLHSRQHRVIYAFFFLLGIICAVDINFIINEDAVLSETVLKSLTFLSQSPVRGLGN